MIRSVVPATTSTTTEASPKGRDEPLSPTCKARLIGIKVRQQEIRAAETQRVAQPYPAALYTYARAIIIILNTKLEENESQKSPGLSNGGSFTQCLRYMYIRQFTTFQYLLTYRVIPAQIRSPTKTDGKLDTTARLPIDSNILL